MDVCLLYLLGLQGIRSTNGVELDELESALLVLDRDRS